MPYTIDPIEFIREQESRVVKYYSTNKLKLSGFEGRQDFIDWYLHEIYFYENKCHCCKTSILEIRKLLNAGLMLYPVDNEGNKDTRTIQFLRDYFYPGFRKVMFLQDKDNEILRCIKSDKISVPYEQYMVSIVLKSE